MTDEQIEAVWNAVNASDLDVHDLKLAMKLRCRFARAIEQASRRSALEEAAKVCYEMADGWNQLAQGATDGRYDFMAEAGDRCADEIRALSGSTET